MDHQEDIKQELDAIAPLLNNINKKPVQSVPAGYFKQLVVPIPEEAKGAIVNIRSRFQWMRYAVAASVIGILVMGVFVYTNRSVGNFDYEHYSNMDVAAQVNLVTDEDLQSYLTTAAVLTGAGHQVVSEETEFSTETKLEQISDEELSKYLNEDTVNNNFKKSS